jgi:hypothetical protein
VPPFRQGDGDGRTPPLIGFGKHSGARRVDERFDVRIAELTLGLLGDQIVDGEATIDRCVGV